MSKRSIKWDEEKYKKYVKEGRGNGTGKDYKPWLTIQAFPSLGKVSRISGWKTNRVHHLISGNETMFFYFLEWSDKVTDIREQYPLLDYNETQSIAESLGIKHPRDNESGFPYIITTDFLITLRFKEKEYTIARTIKPAKDLEKARVLEKFEIERRYWENRKVNWGIVTDNDISKDIARNIESLHSSYRLEDSYDLSEKQVHQISILIKEMISKSDLSISEIGEHVDTIIGLQAGTGLYMFKHFISTKQILIDITRKIDYDIPAANIVKRFMLKDKAVVI